jgi:hypothetical protein
MSGQDDLFFYGKDIIVDEGFNGRYSIARPNYTSATSAASTVATNVPARVAKSTSAFANYPISGATYFSIFTKVRGVSPGDIITRQGNGLTVTVLNNDDPSCATMGYLTDEVGRITGRADRDIFTNVRFCYLRSGAPTAPINPEFPEAQEYQVRYAAMWERADIQTNMRLIDDRSGLIFRISAIQPIVNVLVLTLKES